MGMGYWMWLPLAMIRDKKFWFGTKQIPKTTENGLLLEWGRELTGYWSQRIW
jgi:hypothetical protein